MGRDKAVLAAGSEPPMLVRTAKILASVTGNCSVVAPAGRYEAFGFPVVDDRWPGEGPLGGILTAIESSESDCNLIVAVDMPFLDSSILHALLSAGGTAVAHTDRLHPLCAVYQRADFVPLKAYFDGGGRRVLSAIEHISFTPVDVSKYAVTNVNTPAEWKSARG